MIPPRFRFAELQQVAGLERLDTEFLAFLREQDADLCDALSAYRSAEASPPPVEVSALLLAAAPYVEQFLSALFEIEENLARLQATTYAEDVVQRFKKEFVLRRARRYRKEINESFAALSLWLQQSRTEADEAEGDAELATARFAGRLLDSPNEQAGAIERLTQWCALALTQPDAFRTVRNWTSFKLPERVDHAHLVPLERTQEFPVSALQAGTARLRQRDGFQLTDRRMSERAVHDEVHYCLYCHDKDGDFCSKGFPEKKGQPELGLKVDPLGVTLTGCPLEEKISEMNLLKRDGFGIAALAVAMIDNPMVPATGHRICNDCMKACIYQKQDPVNIPEIETRVLTDVLALPWGVEIYDLLTRWNPLRRRQYLPRPYNGRKVLIAGMGPAGFTMAHHLSMEGCAVVGVDGLKIEPLPEHLLKQPVRDWNELVESLDERILLGFGGVAEYGITVRWDKNFLKLIYLTLARRPSFQVFGGVRLGGTVTVEDAWSLGFDHVCVATGTGLPRVIHMGNSLARGMRQASDFLMALQLTGAGKDSSLANLQVRLPAVVIGGGLTAIDTATEVQAYYIKQVEKILSRYEELAASPLGKDLQAGLSEEDQSILAEFLDHGRAVRAERQRAAALGEQPDFISLLRGWGGVSIVYRKGINASPAYVRNHEEIIKAMEEGIYYAEGLDPLRVELDRYGHVSKLVARRMHSKEGRWLASSEEVSLPARAVLVAAGAVPNIIYEQEHPGTFQLEGDHFLPHVEHADGLQPVQVAEHCKAPEFGPFTSYQQDGRYVSFLGDTNPVFHGSVVKAIASSLRSYPQIMEALGQQPATDTDFASYLTFRTAMDRLLAPRVARVVTDNPAFVELWVHAPMAARNFKPGQFYRLQTFEAGSQIVKDTRLQIPLMTVSGTGVKDDQVRLMVLQSGPTARLITRLRPGDPLVLMGPTGAPTHIPRNETVLVVAGRWGAAAMLDLGAALRAAGNRVLYVGAFASADEVDHQEELEAAADQIIWCTRREPIVPPRRPQDLSVAASDVIDVLHRYHSHELGDSESPIALEQVDRILVMGSTGLLRGFQTALEDSLSSVFRADVQAIGTVGSPMQCMLKGVCAQCLQWQIDPDTGQRTRPVFSCAQQDQPLAWIDLDNLAARQMQNRLPDRLSGLWLEYVLGEREV